MSTDVPPVPILLGSWPTPPFEIDRVAVTQINGLFAEVTAPTSGPLPGVLNIMT